ncbi:MAG TPA: hypothetical protein VIB00_19165 [Pyrinomonadaceae bacterium]|jgi:hypothetical protein
MLSGPTVEVETTSGYCAGCGIPVDSQYFDDSSVQPAPDTGEELVLARFDLPAQYCGVLQYFSQFTDAFGSDASKIATPTIEWKILVNNHALFPYINLRRIVNPWGYGSYAVNIRLEETSTVELVARGVVDDGSLSGTNAGGPIEVVGGRIVGRFWYNASYGDVVRRRA